MRSLWAAPRGDVKRPTVPPKRDRRFNLAYFRHTDQWWEVVTGLTLDECLKLIEEGGIFSLVS